MNERPPARLVEVRVPEGETRLGMVRDAGVVDLTGAGSGLRSTLDLIEKNPGRALPRLIEGLAEDRPIAWSWAELDRPPVDYPHLTSPIAAPEIWGAGVTYERSRDAREAESEGFSRFYAMVYEAERPELFLKTGRAARVSGPNAPIGIRHDSDWTVPEPELALVLDDDGSIVGYTIGNDLTARDVEAENPLYLAQAKTFVGSCALGPTLLLHEEGVNPLDWTIEMRIMRKGEKQFEGSVRVARMRRSLEELARYLCMDNEIAAGTVLLTGTGIVPPDEVALAPGDVVEIQIDPIGVLRNPALPSGELRRALRDGRGR